MSAASKKIMTPLPGQGGNPAIAGAIVGGPQACKGAFLKIKSVFILRKKIFNFLNEKKKLIIIKYNKNIQERMYININHYKAYSETKTPIELDIIPI